MKDTKYLEIIKAPVITEKSMADKENGKYTFKVDPRANKIEIKNAIEKKEEKSWSLYRINESYKESNCYFS